MRRETGGGWRASELSSVRGSAGWSVRQSYPNSFQFSPVTHAETGRIRLRLGVTPLDCSAFRRTDFQSVLQTNCVSPNAGEANQSCPEAAPMLAFVRPTLLALAGAALLVIPSEAAAQGASGKAEPTDLFASPAI